ncbi:hypothetical protein WMO27_11165 [Lachnospiraceae bacterium CLA-AA-H183]
MNRVSKKVWNISDILFFLIILLEDAGTFGIFPIGIAQVFTLVLGAKMIVEMLYQYGKLKVSGKLIILFVYMIVITILFPFDIKTISGFCLFVMEMLTFYFYLKRIDNYNKLISIIYNAGFTLAIIGVIQEIGYVFHIDSLTNMQLYGFPREGVYYVANSPLARVSSLYSEPASLIAIMSATFMIIFFWHQKNTVTMLKNIIIIGFIVLTQSTLLYVACGIIIMVYIFFSNQDILNKFKWIIILLSGFCCVTLWNYQFIARILRKLLTLKNTSSTSTSDLSAFALISNLQIALSKIKDGYLFGTGYNSHRLYYERYINELYDQILMKLNYADAASMYIRSLSEFGIIGLSFIIFVIIYAFIKGYKQKNNFKIFCATVLGIALLRDGNYIRTLNIVFFLLIFIFNNEDRDELFKVCDRVYC